MSVQVNRAVVETLLNRFADCTVITNKHDCGWLFFRSPDGKTQYRKFPVEFKLGKKLNAIVCAGADMYDVTLEPSSDDPKMMRMHTELRKS